ncbi:MAG: hypothetical protein IPN24_11190 [Betaproteobacteria bacterium]|nr:hypothetical protein [Betaproteobacteria bacterium]
MTGNYGPEGIAAAVKKAADEVDRWRKAEASAPSESWAEQYAMNLDKAEKKLKALKAIRTAMIGRLGRGLSMAQQQRPKRQGANDSRRRSGERPKPQPTTTSRGWTTSLRR